jgi:hypothetical protein
VEREGAVTVTILRATTAQEMQQVSRLLAPLDAALNTFAANVRRSLNESGLASIPAAAAAATGHN